METAGEYLRAASQVLQKRASEATPGPWERPLDTRSKSSVIAHLPMDEQPDSWMDGIVPEEFGKYSGPLGRYAGQREPTTVATIPAWSNGKHMRKRSGRDLEYIALMDPSIGVLLAYWLEHQAVLRESGRYAKGAPGDKWAFDIAEKILGRAYVGA